MMIIRQKHMRAFEQAMRGKFRADMVLRARDYFPDVYAALGENRVCRLVDEISEQAKIFDINSETDVCLFIDLAWIFGPHFYHQYPWAIEVLNDPMQNDPRTKTETLYQAGVNSLVQDGEHGLSWYELPGALT